MYITHRVVHVSIMRLSTTIVDRIHPTGDRPSVHGDADTFPVAELLNQGVESVRMANIDYDYKIRYRILARVFTRIFPVLNQLS